MLTEYLFDERGKTRRGRMIYFVMVLFALAAFGGLGAAFTELFHDTTIQAVWLLFSVFLLKLPLLGFLWWLIARNKEWPGAPVVWSVDETNEILGYLRSEATRAVDLPDADARLEYLSREAWHVADKADGTQKADAVGVALQIDSMRSRTRGRRPV